jgi:hypothetical protein
VLQQAILKISQSARRRLTKTRERPASHVLCKLDEAPHGQRLGIKHPPLSLQIRQFEKEMGTPLIFSDRALPP